MSAGRWFPLVVAAAFVAVLAASVRSGMMPAPVLWICAAASAAAFVAYGLDKSAAARGRPRTRERTLHLLALAGGWPGALAGQRVFRHKTQKVPFRIALGLTVLLHCGALAWWLAR